MLAMMMKNTRYLVLAALLVACGQGSESGRDDYLSPTDPEAAAATGTAPGSEEGGAASGTESTFDHPAALGGSAVTAREALERMAEEGPPGYTARIHGCRKMPYRTLGRVLAGLGVNLDAMGETDAGNMWRRSDQALGAANYGARIGESTEVTVSVASRTFDILVQAAPEVIANLPSVERCMIGGVGVSVFDGAGHCTRDGLSCLLGEPASDVVVAQCDDVVRRAADPAQGQAIAVASLLSAAHTCE